ncbi:MAG: hypothetical protein IJT69_03340 [Clostridia bacterium]|nr:hypothetical protein [Clostridia bacterium]
MKKRIIVLIVCMVFCIVALPLGVYAFAASNNSSQNENNVSGVTDAGVVLPRVGEDYVSADFAMPDPNGLVKEWYKYIEFEEDGNEYAEGNDIIRYYKPIDYELSAVMSYSPLEMVSKTGSIGVRDEEINAIENYTTASSITVSYTISRGEARDFTAGLELGMEGGLSGLLDKVKTDLTLSSSSSKNQTYTRTFEKVDEISIPWRVVEYTVQLPIKVKIINKSEVIDEGFYLINIMTGTCRQWADGTIEHWQTGERVTIENFEADFCTAESILKRARQDWN